MHFAKSAPAALRVGGRITPVTCTDPQHLGQLALAHKRKEARALDGRVNVCSLRDVPTVRHRDGVRVRTYPAAMSSLRETVW